MLTNTKDELRLVALFPIAISNWILDLGGSRWQSSDVDQLALRFSPTARGVRPIDSAEARQDLANAGTGEVQKVRGVTAHPAAERNAPWAI